MPSLLDISSICACRSAFEQEVRSNKNERVRITPGMQPRIPDFIPDRLHNDFDIEFTTFMEPPWLKCYSMGLSMDPFLIQQICVSNKAGPWFAKNTKKSKYTFFITDSFEYFDSSAICPWIIRNLVWAFLFGLPSCSLKSLERNRNALLLRQSLLDITHR